MPAMDGPTLVGRLRQDHPGLKALLMSGYTGDVVASAGGLDPTISFLEKPFSIAALAQKVRETIDGDPGEQRA